MMLILMLLTFLQNEQNDSERFLKLAKNLTEPSKVERICDLENEVSELLVKMSPEKNNFEYQYLRAVKSDIKIMRSYGSSGGGDISSTFKKFTDEKQYYGRLPLDMATLDEMVSARAELIRAFGECSFIDLFATRQLLTFKALSYPQKNLTNEISFEIARFEKSTWAGSPFLSNFYMIQCANAKNIGDFELMYKNSLISKERIKLIIGGKPEVALLSPVSFEFRALNGLKRYHEILEQFKNVPNKLLDNSDKISCGLISPIYSAVAASYLDSGKIDHAIVYQELALAKIHQRFEDRNNLEVTEQALKFREILKLKKDYVLLRKIEERYTLVPLGKFSDEN